MNILNDRRQLLKGILSSSLLASVPLLLSSSSRPYYVIVNAAFSGHYKQEGIEQFNATVIALEELKRQYPQLKSVRVIKTDNKCRADLVERSIENGLMLVPQKNRVLFVTGGSSSVVFKKQQQFCMKHNLMHLGGICTLPKLLRKSYSAFPTTGVLNKNVLPELKENERLLTISDMSNWGIIASQGFINRARTKIDAHQISHTSVSQFRLNMIEDVKYVYIGAYDQHTFKIITKVLDASPEVTVVLPVLSLYTKELLPKKYHSRVITSKFIFNGSENFAKTYIKNHKQAPGHVGRLSYLQSKNAISYLMKNESTFRPRFLVNKLGSNDGIQLRLKSARLNEIA